MRGNGSRNRNASSGPCYTLSPATFRSASAASSEIGTEMLPVPSSHFVLIVIIAVAAAFTCYALSHGVGLVISLPVSTRRVSQLVLGALRVKPLLVLVQVLVLVLAALGA